MLNRMTCQTTEIHGEGRALRSVTISALNNLHFLGFCVRGYKHSVFDFQPNFKAEYENYRKEELFTGRSSVFTDNDLF